METTLVIVKPNAMKQNKAGAIIQKFQDKGLKLKGLKVIKISRTLCEEFYAEHKGRPFFPEFVKFMTSAPVVILALSGQDAVASVRTLMGHTDPKKAGRGTIRFEYGESIGENAVHGSDSVESARRELGLLFEDRELCD